MRVALRVDQMVGPSDQMKGVTMVAQRVALLAT